MKCFGDLTLSFGSNPVISGGTASMIGGGLTGCEGELIQFFVNYEDANLKLSRECFVISALGGCSISMTTFSPGTYTIYARINKNRDQGDTDYDDVGERANNVLTINNVGSPISLTRILPGPSECHYSHDLSSGICHDEWQPSVECLCQLDYSGSDHCCDPLRCSYPSVTASNLCCPGSTDNSYDPGPGRAITGTPCLSPDTNTGWPDLDYPIDDTTYIQSDNIAPNNLFRRNILVKDDGYFDTSNNPINLASFGNSGGWIRIKIGLNPRPIYGVQVYASNLTNTASFTINIYGADESTQIYTNAVTVSRPMNNFGEYNFRPGGWVWDNVTWIEIEGSADLHVDYVGLLAKETPGGVNVPYCSNGNTYMSRIVNDASYCYWNLMCPTYTDDGWTGDGPRDVVGAFGECDCTPFSLSRPCGRGYCEKTLTDGRKLCYYQVECAHGGWRSGDTSTPVSNLPKLAFCTASQSCTSSGCV